MKRLDKTINGVVDVVVRVGVLVIPIILLYMGIGLILAFPLMWLWNYTIPDLTNGIISNIRYWQAWALIVLCSILFGGGSSPKD